MMEDKSLFVYDYVNLKNRQLVRKHGKKRSLGDVNGKYRYHAPQQTPSVMGSLINLDFPETRAINTKSADAIISDQSHQIRNTYQKQFRASTLDAWSRPESSLDNNPYSNIDNRPQTAPESLQDLQPQVNNRVNANSNNRPHTTGSRSHRTPSRKPPNPSGFMVVKMKPDGSVKNMGFKSVTQEIREWWDEDDKKQREKARKAHSQSLKRYDQFAGQWLSFAGDTEEAEGGVIEAFTGKVPKDEFYNIESRVGATVATQLKNGNKVRVGVNGSLQSNSLRVKKWKNDPDTKVQVVENIFRDARAAAPSPVPFKKETEGKVRNRSAENLIPLSWTEQVTKPNVKVLGLREPSSPREQADLSESHPVVFHPLLKDGSKPQRSIKLGKYRINQQSRSKIGIDGAESLNNRITHVTIDQIDRADSEYRELTDADYENLLKEKLRSVSMEAEEEVEEDDELLESVNPRRHTEDMREVSTYSISKDSDVSGLTVEKPATVRSQGSTSDVISVTQSNSRPERPYVRQVASAMPSTRQARSRDSQLSAPPRSMIRSAGSQRIQPPMDNSNQRLGARSAGSQRALSSASSRIKYSFDQKVTPKASHSPRPNLARPGQLPRSKVSSISTGPQEGDQEYIKFSQQILKPGESKGGHDPGMMALSNYGDLTQGQYGRMRNPSISSMDDGGSVDSMNVHRGDPAQERHHYHEDGTKCTCSPEAKRVMSAALTAMSHVSTDHSVINIPTAPMTPFDSDRNSLSDMDPLSSTSSFQRASLGDDDWKESSFDQVAESGDHASTHGAQDNHQGSEVTSPTPSKEIVINRHDGLDSLGITPPRSAGKKRTVKFSDEIAEPFVPYTSPISTPRDPLHPGSAEGSLHSGEFVHSDNPRPDLTAPSEMSGEASGELNELRAKIKADLQKSQAETEQDLREMKSPAPVN